VLYLPVNDDAQRVGTSLDTLKNGRTLYINNCASCHNLYSPEKFTSKEWRKNVTAMQKRAKINDAQKEIILKYLTAKLQK
jgi:nitrate/TMAO reductase-like tetraheme cytochrome c subunit